MSSIPQPVVPLPLQLSYVSLAGEQVPAATRENAHLLQHAADYEVCVRNLRRSGVGDICWGLLCCWLGGSLIRYNYLDGAVLLLGVALMSIGIWITAKPSPIGMVCDGILLLVIAAWNILIFAMEATRAASGVMGVGLIVGLAQVGWGVYRLKQYPRFATAVAMQPSATTLQWLRDLAKATLKARPGGDPTLIDFVRKGSFSYEKWKGRLLPEVAVLVMNAGSFGGRRDILLATQDSMRIIQRKKQLLRSRFKVKLQVGQRTPKVLMPEKSLMKLESWLIAPQVATVVAVPMV